jgi:K+-sensing histidine kinase KdpD
MKSASRSVLPGYGVAGVSTALATLAQLSLRPIMGSEQPFSFFYVAVLVSAWYGGLRQALLTLTLGALSAAYFFLPPDNSLVVTGAANQVGLALYLCVALTGTLLIDTLRQQQRAAEERVQPQALFLTREQALRADAQEARQRLAAEQQASRALADQLEAAREALAQANAELQRQHDEIEQLTETLPRRGGVSLRAG